ncbi:MAG: hypothetical protein JNM80_07200 [Phycisphaerae bacterium]|nr:hypothetical protein [Phycisphaerae bacterium]
MPPTIHRLVPYVYVTDVEATLDFYALLGFEAGRVERFPDGRLMWAWAECRGAGGVGPAIMFERSSGPPDPMTRDTFFYMHCDDAEGLRARLLAAGLGDGGRFLGRGTSPMTPRTVYEMSRPAYMPGGEFRVHDPDAYAILIGQCE